MRFLFNRSLDVIKEYGYGFIHPVVALLSLFNLPKTDHLPDPAKKTIVLVFCWFLPNMGHNKWVTYLEKKDYNVYLVNLPLLGEDFQKTAGRLKQFITKHKLKQYTLVGISTGSLVCLTFLQQYHKWNEIRRLICVGGPLHGTPRAHLISFLEKGKAMLPQSTFIRRLLHNSIQKKKMVTISASYDELVPSDYSILQGITSYVLPIWGHNRLHLESKETYVLIAKLAKE